MILSVLMTEIQNKCHNTQSLPWHQNSLVSGNKGSTDTEMPYKFLRKRHKQAAITSNLEMISVRFLTGVYRLVPRSHRCLCSSHCVCRLSTVHICGPNTWPWQGSFQTTSGVHRDVRSSPGAPWEGLLWVGLKGANKLLAMEGRNPR